MKKLLRILFVICTVAFVTTVTACADDDDDNQTTTGFFKFEAAAKGVTIDTSKDVYTITINPSSLAYTGSLAPIFTVTFNDTQKGLIIATDVDKAESITSSVIANGDDAAIAATADGASTVYTYFTPDAQNKPGITTQINNTTVSDAHIDAAGVADDAKVGINCVTTITGITSASFATAEPAADADVAIGDDTETVCNFDLDIIGADDDVKLQNRKDWATAVVAAAADAAADAKPNYIQKVNFVGIVTGDAKASEISKVGSIPGVDAIDLEGEDNDVPAVPANDAPLSNSITTKVSAKLAKEYTIGFQKVEIVIEAAK